MLVLKDRGEKMNENNCEIKIDNIISKQMMNKWYEAIAEDAVLFDEKGGIMFDYEVADTIKKYIGFCGEVIVKAPYILFKEVLLPTDVLAAFMYIDESKITSMDNKICIIDCRNLVSATSEPKPTLNKEDFAKDMLSFIYHYGSTKHLTHDDIQDFNNICNDAETLLNLESEVILDVEDGVIAIAIDEYISDAKETIGYRLGLRPNCFIEVSSPWNTVLLIDCKYISLANAYELEEEEWLY